MMSEVWSTSSSQNPLETINIFNNAKAQDVLKCCLCEKFLSTPPIFSFGSESICGRCKFVNKSEDTKWSRQIVYESLAQFMIFPCSNITYGCKAQLNWGDVEEHENTCLFKKLNCPFYNDDVFGTDKCRWQGSGPGLNEHLEAFHGNLIKKLPEINFAEVKSNMIFLARILKQLMIVTLVYNEPKISCLVMVNGTSADCDSYRYQLEIFDDHRKNSLILRRSRLEDAVGFHENMVNPDKNLIVDLDAVKDLLKSPDNIIGKFGIIKKSKKEMTYAERSPGLLQDPTFDDNLLRELECPVCKNYMVPPIHICTTGHSFCSSCKEQMDECPTCRHDFQNGRNFTLEKLTALITYPCIYKEAGCYATCTSDQIKEHESNCGYSGTQCFLSCTKGPVINMFKHLNEKHHDCLIVSGDLVILDVGDEYQVIKCYAVCFGNDIFRVAVKYDEVSTDFAVHQFGVSQSNYSYDLEIFCSTECNDKLTISRECAPMSNSNSMWQKSISIPDNMMERFVSEEGLIFFKICLKKN